MGRVRPVDRGVAYVHDLGLVTLENGATPRIANPIYA